MKFLGYDRVFCISPHPDDVEYSMLGTILKYKDTTFQSFQMCEGGNYDASTSVKRLDEVLNVWNNYKPCNFGISFTSYKRIEDLKEDKWINLIESELTTHRYDAILIPNEFDSHFEHRFVSGFGKALIRSHPISLIQYKTPSTTQEWVPNLFVDIFVQYKTKLKLLKEFESQQHRYYFREEVLRAFHSDFQSAKKGKHYVEQFKILESYQ